MCEDKACSNLRSGLVTDTYCRDLKIQPSNDAYIEDKCTGGNLHYQFIIKNHKYHLPLTLIIRQWVKLYLAPVNFSFPKKHRQMYVDKRFYHWNWLVGRPWTRWRTKKMDRRYSSIQGIKGQNQNHWCVRWLETTQPFQAHWMCLSHIFLS